MRMYYYHRNGENYGPFTLEELAKENIKGDTLVWFKGMNEWMYARNVKELELLVKRHHYVESPPPLPQKSNTTTPLPVVLSAAAPAAKNKPDYTMNTILAVLIIGAIIFVGYFISLQRAQTSYNYPQNEQTTDQTEPEQNAENAEVVNTIKPVQESQEQKLLRLHGQIDNTWYQFLRVDVDPNYTVSPLGGIQNVYVNISNDSDYLISHLVYEVGYVKQNGDFWKSEEIIQHDIQPRSSIRVRVPDSHRGVRVNKPYIGFMAINSINYKWIDPENESIYDRVLSLGLWQ